MIDIKKDIAKDVDVYGLSGNGNHIVMGNIIAKDEEVFYFRHIDGNVIRVFPSGLHLTVKGAFKELDTRNKALKEKAEELAKEDTKK